jgi:hypothetical protein
MVDAQLLHETLKLPLSEIEVDGFKDGITTSQAYFKVREKAKTTTNGWKVVEASDPKMNGVDVIYAQKASIEVASNLLGISTIVCSNNNKQGGHV